MNSREYLTEVLRYYRSSFDVSLPYSLGGRDYEALAEFHASTEKYILVRQFRLWSENTDEFVLFSLFEGGAPTWKISARCKRLFGSIWNRCLCEAARKSYTMKIICIRT